MFKIGLASTCFLVISLMCNINAFALNPNFISISSENEIYQEITTSFDSVSIFTDKQRYSYGQIPKIFGFVNQVIPNEIVSINLNNYQLGAEVDQNGQFQVINIPKEVVTRDITPDSLLEVKYGNTQFVTNFKTTYEKNPERLTNSQYVKKYTKEELVNLSDKARTTICESRHDLADLCAQAKAEFDERNKEPEWHKIADKLNNLVGQWLYLGSNKDQMTVQEYNKQYSIYTEQIQDLIQKLKSYPDGVPFALQTEDTYQKKIACDSQGKLYDVFGNCSEQSKKKMQVKTKPKTPIQESDQYTMQNTSQNDIQKLKEENTKLKKQVKDLQLQVTKMSKIIEKLKLALQKANIKI